MITRILPSEIVNLIISFMIDPYLIPATKMLLGEHIEYTIFNAKDENRKTLEKLSRLPVNNSVIINDIMLDNFFMNYISLQTRDIRITEILLEKYKDSLYVNECFDFLTVKTLEERKLFEQYRDILGASYYEGKFSWEHPIGTFI